MSRFIFAALSTAIFVFASLQPALAADVDKKARKAFIAEIEAHYNGPVWALKDLPVKSGYTIMAPWIAPLTDVTPTGFVIEGGNTLQATYGSVNSVWYGVRPSDKLTLKEVDYDDGEFILALIGVDESKGHDTKIRITGTASLADVQAVLDELITTANPVDQSWPNEIQTAVNRRLLVNGMTKRQAYMVVGEPISSSVTEENGKKVEIWNPRQNNGMRIGFGVQIETSGFPVDVRFEDGKLVGVATNVSGGVSLD